MLKKHIIPFLVFFVINSINAQNSEEIFTVDVYINSDMQIYLEDKLIENDNIEKEMSDHAFKNNAFYDDQVLYRIYADRKLNLGVIMNVNNQLIKAFHPSTTKTERYLLDTQELDVNESTWQNNIQKLNLKAIDN
ncbi:hypothetical protein [Christiangramia echinicola]|uniref:GLPGLI family protein n=1 Tax=Christiangramia echinicola TaxID=279359 RepID=A0A1H1M036_9FLAO|nr:hypothetical protein [Christiangramia echinicola]SDR80037.1 hypothetical protein SAMN04488552_1087 [Christiangramia echinicola]